MMIRRFWQALFTTRDQPGAESTSQPRWWELRRWESGRIGTVLGADLRSLAVLRIVMAFLVLYDVVNRVPNLGIHYTDEGVMPRSLLVDDFVRWRWSVNLVNDMYAFQLACLVVTAIAAICMMLGYRTRLMSVIVWVMITSLQVRNPLVLSGADTFLRVVLFWLMFLPLGAVWSIDSLRRGEGAGRLSYRFLSFASIGLFAQIAFVYLFTAILKSDPEWRSEGTALEYALNAHHITKPFGEFLSDFPELLRVLTHASLGLEFLVPVMIFFPFWNGQLRTLAVGSIMAFHLGIFLTMDVGLFPWLSALCMTGLLPTWFWEDVVPRVARHVPARFDGLGVRWRRLRAALNERLVPSGVAGTHFYLATIGSPGGAVADQREQSHTRETDRAGDSEAEAPRGGAAQRVVRSLPITNLFLACCLVFVFLWNLATVTDFTMPAEARPFAYSSGLYQSWNMFAPHPSKGTVWLVVRGVLADGREVDLLTPIVHQDLSRVPKLTWSQPDDIVGEYYGDKYWRKYLTALGRESQSEERRAFAAYTCRTWNAHYGGDVELAGLQVIKMSQRTSLEGEDTPIHRDVVSEFRCV